MSEDTKNMEALLRQLKPRQPSSELKERIESTVAEHRKSTASLGGRVIRLFAPIAACFAVVGGVYFALTKDEASRPLREVPAEKASVFDVESLKLVSSSNALVAAEQSEVFFLSNGSPAREIYLKYMDTYEYQSAAFDSTVKVSYPREEIRVIPVLSD